MHPRICDCWLVGLDTRLQADIVADAITAPPHDPQKYTHAMTLKAAEITYCDRFLLCGFPHKRLTNSLGRHSTGFIYIEEEQPTCPACLFMLKTVVTDLKEIL